MFRLILILILANVVFANDIKDCKTCHNIEKFDAKNHDFDCINCHILPQKRTNFTHEDIITQSANSKNMEIFCISCHEKEIKAFKSSNHYTHKNEINKVFKTFGLDTNFTIQNLPNPQKIQSKQDLITNLLRKKCLKCHSENQQSGETRMHRGTGCMSCHAKYSRHGRYEGSDKTMRGKRPYASSHKLLKPTQNACLSCHNKEFTGGEYLGLFPKDYDKSYQSPIDKKGKFPKSIYGATFHHLQSDIHHKAGLTCMNCHKMNKTLSCENCHKIKPNQAHQNYHKNVSCTACHASWQMSNYELNLILDETKDYKKWKNLIKQEDAFLENFLKKNIKSKKPKEPMMKDWISQRQTLGIWYSGWRFRRWENLLLGNDEQGKVQILRPFFQYNISYKDKNQNLIYNSLKAEAFLPHTPHTIGKFAKSCEACHENPLLLKSWQKTNSVLDLLQGKTLNSSHLTKEQRQKLSSEKYKKIRAKMLLKENYKD